MRGARAQRGQVEGRPALADRELHHERARAASGGVGEGEVAVGPLPHDHPLAGEVEPGLERLPADHEGDRDQQHQGQEDAADEQTRASAAAVRRPAAPTPARRPSSRPR
ncbi:hypothetical protein G5V59_07810 [Nocardioides sp. W3-2-3]|nr:hypothetical protein [Nocardioides convexus]